MKNKRKKEEKVTELHKLKKDKEKLLTKMKAARKGGRGNLFGFAVFSAVSKRDD